MTAGVVAVRWLALARLFSGRVQFCLRVCSGGVAFRLRILSGSRKPAPCTNLFSVYVGLGGRMSFAAATPRRWLRVPLGRSWRPVTRSVACFRLDQFLARENLRCQEVRVRLYALNQIFTFLQSQPHFSRHLQTNGFLKNHLIP